MNIVSFYVLIVCKISMGCIGKMGFMKFVVEFKVCV